jgi:hypothetical protein
MMFSHNEDVHQEMAGVHQVQVVAQLTAVLATTLQVIVGHQADLLRQDQERVVLQRLGQVQTDQQVLDIILQAMVDRLGHRRLGQVQADLQGLATTLQAMVDRLGHQQLGQVQTDLQRLATTLQAVGVQQELLRLDRTLVIQDLATTHQVEIAFQEVSDVQLMFLDILTDQVVTTITATDTIIRTVIFIDLTLVTTILRTQIT